MTTLSVPRYCSGQEKGGLNFLYRWGASDAHEGRPTGEHHRHPVGRHAVGVAGCNKGQTVKQAVTGGQRPERVGTRKDCKEGTELEAARTAAKNLDSAPITGSIRQATKDVETDEGWKVVKAACFLKDSAEFLTAKSDGDRRLIVASQRPGVAGQAASVVGLIKDMKSKPDKLSVNLYCLLASTH